VVDEIDLSGRGGSLLPASGKRGKVLQGNARGKGARGEGLVGGEWSMG